MPPAQNKGTAPAEAGASSGGIPKGQPRPMTVEYAKQLVSAAKKAACSTTPDDCSGAFAIADDAGVIVYLETIDGVMAGAPELAIRKAKTPAIWRRPTQTFADAVKSGSNMSYADGTFPDMTTSPGGITIVKDGRVVGGFGPAGTGSRAANELIGKAVVAEATKIFGKQ
jgi:uncharacterized protein GlcG (DUF336 family)